MASGRKKEKPTSEERLQAALLPDWEQPYKVPENWCWTRMQEIAQWGSGGTPSRKVPEYYNGDIPWIKTGELNDDYIFDTEEHITQEAIFHSSAKLFPLNTVVIAMYGATIGKVAILGIPATTNQACACGIANTSTNYKYLFYYARSQKDDFIKKGKGGAQPNISQEIIKFHEFPLPPLPEQQRIVDRVESLFAKLDEAKHKAQDALDSFETRKAAILHKAFTGELTARWRKEHGVGMESRKEKQIGQCSILITKGASPRWQGISYTEDKSQTLFITSENVRQGYLDLSKEKYLDNNINDIQQRSILSKGDVLVNIVGASIGRAAIFDLDCVANINQAVCLIRLKNDLLNTFLCYYLNSPNALMYYDENKVETARANISLKDIREMTIVCPGVEEQTEIVHILDEFLAKEQQAKEAAEAVLEQIDLMKKSILTRAFRGELGTNDPAEESAVELVKEVIERSAEINSKPKTKVKRTVIPAEIKSVLSNADEEEIVKLLMKSAPKAVSVQMIMSISKKKFELMDALRNLEQKQIIIKDSFGEYLLKG